MDGRARHPAGDQAIDRVSQDTEQRHRSNQDPGCGHSRQHQLRRIRQHVAGAYAHVDRALVGPWLRGIAADLNAVARVVDRHTGQRVAFPAFAARFGAYRARVGRENIANAVDDHSHVCRILRKVLAVQRKRKAAGIVAIGRRGVRRFELRFRTTNPHFAGDVVVLQVADRDSQDVAAGSDGGRKPKGHRVVGDHRSGIQLGFLLRQVEQRSGCRSGEPAARDGQHAGRIDRIGKHRFVVDFDGGIECRRQPEQNRNDERRHGRFHVVCVTSRTAGW